MFLISVFHAFISFINNHTSGICLMESLQQNLCAPLGPHVWITVMLCLLQLPSGHTSSCILKQNTHVTHHNNNRQASPWHCISHVAKHRSTTKDCCNSWTRNYTSSLFLSKSFTSPPQKIAMLRSATFTQLSRFLASTQFLPRSTTFAQLWLILDYFCGFLPSWETFWGKMEHGTFEHPQSFWHL